MSDRAGARIDELVSAPEASLIPGEVTKLTVDSREAVPGALFFALEGTRADGHQFVDEVLANGAVAAVVRRGHPLIAGRKADLRVIQVDDPRAALGVAASRFYGNPSKRLLVCAVTGTKGKTTTTYLLEAVLREWGMRPGVIGTVENRFEDFKSPASHTTPDAVGLQALFHEFLRRGARSVAIEVSSHALDQLRVHGTGFESAIFTNLTRDHLDYHQTVENYFAAKTRLFTDYPLKVRAIHQEDPYGRELASLCMRKGFEVITFGKSGCNVNYGALQLSEKGIEGNFSISWKQLRQKLSVRSPLLGSFNAENLAGAVAAALGMGVPLPVISTALSKARLVPGRMEAVPNDQGLTVVVDYAHAPDPLEKALQMLRRICRGKLICVFGCGGDRDRGKRPLMGAIAERLADSVIVTSDNPRTEDPESIIDAIFEGIQDRAKVRRIPDRRQAIAEAIAGLRHGDILLIAGKGHEDYQIIGTTKQPFDDRQVARENLSSPRRTKT